MWDNAIKCSFKIRSMPLALLFFNFLTADLISSIVNGVFICSFICSCCDSSCVEFETIVFSPVILIKIE